MMMKVAFSIDAIVFNRVSHHFGVVFNQISRCFGFFFQTMSLMKMKVAFSAVSQLDKWRLMMMINRATEVAIGEASWSESMRRQVEEEGNRALEFLFPKSFYLY